MFLIFAFKLKLRRYSQELTFRKLVDMQFIAAMGPPGGRG
jgi:hypothetical protein